jgi:hypothetical protein
MELKGVIMKKLILIITFMIISVAFLKADFYVKTKIYNSTAEIAGQKIPEKTKYITEQWLGKDKMAMVMKKQTMIIDMSRNKLFFIYHSIKSFVEANIPLENRDIVKDGVSTRVRWVEYDHSEKGFVEANEPLNMKKLLPKELESMIGTMKITVTPNGQTKTINGWKCVGYSIDMDMMMWKTKSTSWMTTDVPFDWKIYYAGRMYEYFLQALLPMLDRQSLGEFKKIKGMQIALETSMSRMGKEIKITSEVVEISKKPAPAGIFSVPTGYKKLDTIIMSMFEQ